MAETVARPDSPSARPTRRTLLASLALAAPASALPAVAALAAERPVASPDPLPALWRQLEGNERPTGELAERREDLEATLAAHGALARTREASVSFPVRLYGGGTKPLACHDEGQVRLMAPPRRHRRLLAELRRRQAEVAAFRERHGLAALDRELEALTREWRALVERVSTEPASSPAGVAVKVRRLLAALTEGEYGFEDECGRTAIEALDRLAGEARHA